MRIGKTSDHQEATHHGTTLFDRIGGRLQLSDHGRAFQPHAEELMTAMEHARRSIDNPVTNARPIRVAGFPSAVAHIIAPRLAHRFGDSTQTTLLIREAEDDVALREVGLGHCDLAIVQEYSHLPSSQNPRLTYTHLASDPLMLVVHKG